MSKDSNDTPKATVWAYDIETLPNLFSLTAKQCGTDTYKVFLCYDGVNEIEKMVAFMDQPRHRSPLTWFAGYNNRDFDDRVVVWIMENVQYLLSHTGGEAAHFIYKKAQEIIDSDDFWVPPHDRFQSLDLYRIPRLHHYRKGLKLVAVNLKWGKVQDMPIGHDHMVEPHEVDDVLAYNQNDVDITERLFEDQKPDIQLRNAISNTYGINVMSEDESGIGNRLLEKFYAQATGMPKWEFKKLKTTRHRIPLREVIFDHVHFRTKKMQRFLEELKEVTIDETLDKKTKNKLYKWSVLLGNTVHDMALGGLHSSGRHYPAIWESDDEGTLIDCDVASYYPRMVLNHRIKPEHLDFAYLKIFERFYNERISLKPRKKESVLISAIVDALKIVLNAASFGKLGDEKWWMFDLKALYQVTINGQLNLLMLIERLEEAGIPVWYSNTDGITAKVPHGKEDVYAEICSNWERELNLELEFDRYKKAVVRDVNEYIIQKEDGSFKKKGDLDDRLYEDVTKSFAMPVIAKAVEEYFFKGVSVSDSLQYHPDILDFCKAQNVGHQFSLELHELDEADMHLRVTPLQRTVRFFVAKKGGTLQKRKKDGSIEALAGTKGVLVYVLNDVPEDEYERKALLNLVDLKYYERECTRIIAPFEQKQMSLML